MICLLSAVDLLLSSSAAHYCSHKAARSGERQGGRDGGGRKGRESSPLQTCLRWSFSSRDVWLSNSSRIGRAGINEWVWSGLISIIIFIIIAAVEKTVFLHLCFMDEVTVERHAGRVQGVDDIQQRFSRKFVTEAFKGRVSSPQHKLGSSSRLNATRSIIACTFTATQQATQEY